MLDKSVVNYFIYMKTIEILGCYIDSIIVCKIFEQKYFNGTASDIQQCIFVRIITFQ